MASELAVQWSVDEPIVEAALRDIGYWDSHSQLLQTAFETGVAGKSRVWLVALRLGGLELSLIAKFDDPERAHVEWQAIRSLRRRPIQALMPLPQNAEHHGVTLYENAAGQVQTGVVWSLKRLLQERLLGRTDHCAVALELLIDPLRLLYAGEPGMARSTGKTGGATWGEAFPRITTLRPEITAHFDASLLVEGLRTLPNPLDALDSLLGERCGNVLRSRVHGDLNLTNVLVGLGGAYQPQKLFLIDLAGSADYAVTAFDLARLETEFLHDVFVPLSCQQDAAFNKHRCAATVTAMHDCMAGRAVVARGDLPAFAERGIEWLQNLRVKAGDVLRSNLSDYRMQDYVVGLYLQHLRSLAFPSVQNTRFGRTIATLGAALALEYLVALQQGHDPPLPLVLPINPEADDLRISSRAWQRSYGPGALLRADYAIVPFQGREPELAELDAWVASSDEVGVRLYAGAGGLGKTRLALELCRRLRSRGIRAGFLREANLETLSILLSGGMQGAAPLVIVVDYADRQREWIATLIREVLGSSRRGVRIILLARSAGTWWDRLKRERVEVGEVLRAARAMGLSALSLSPGERGHWYRCAAIVFAEKLGRPVPKDQPDLAAPHFERALFVHMEALMNVEGAHSANSDEILDWMLDRERRSWDELLAANQLSPHLAAGFGQALAKVTLVKGAQNLREAVALFKGLSFRDESNATISAIAHILHDNYGGRQWIEPLQPDLLGEHLVSKEMENGLDEGLF